VDWEGPARVRTHRGSEDLAPITLKPELKHAVRRSVAATHDQAGLEKGR